MPSVQEISKYNNKYIVLKKDVRVYEEEINEDIIFEIDRILVIDDQYVISDAATTLTYARSCYETLYVNDIDNNNLCSLCAASELLLLCGYYDSLLPREIFNESLAYQGEVLLMSFACGRFNLIATCYSKIIDSIRDGKMSRSLSWRHDGEGNIRPPEPQRLGVLAVEMMASERKQTIDWASANIPADPFYSRFCKEALYSEDEDTLVYWLTKLCDNHLQWTSLTLENAERSSSTGYEIEQKVLLLWPFEYQAVRNFRARYGLSTPEIDHPLLKTSMAIEHRPNFNEWKKPDWFAPLIDKITEVNPELNFVREWF